MAQVLLLSATAANDQTLEHWAPLLDLKTSAEQDRFRVHKLTHDPVAAEIILFVESYGAGWHFERVRRHRYTRDHRGKCFIYCCNPFVIPFLPGVYTGVDTRWASARTASGFYIGVSENEFTKYEPANPEPPHLFSFTGSTVTAPIRRQLASLKHPRALFQDTSADFARVLSREISPADRETYYRRYADATKKSKFVLCPRGLSASTIRVFETMRMGRAPVILSDRWVPPVGPNWDAFAIRVGEKDYQQLPRILEERERDAMTMGERARQEWLEWFADDVKFHRAVDWCLALKERRRVPETLAHWPVYFQYLRPFHFRRALSLKYQAVKKRGRSTPLRL